MHASLPETGSMTPHLISKGLRNLKSPQVRMNYIAWPWLGLIYPPSSSHRPTQLPALHPKGYALKEA